MYGSKLDEKQKLALRSGDHCREQDARGGVDIDRNQHCEKENCSQIREKNCPGRNGEVNEVHVISAIREDGVPTPDGNRAAHGHGEHDKEILVGQRHQKRVRKASAA